MVSLLLLLLPSLLHCTAGSVYNVTPDDHYYSNTTCHHCHNLQHYLLNITKYFTSNTQLLFLPGLHHLHTDLILQNVHNISLIGSTTNGTTPDTVIQCNSSVGIVLTNITNLVIKNIIISNCTKCCYKFFIGVDLFIEHCYSFQLDNVKIFGSPLTFHRSALVARNVLGSSVFTDLTSNGIIVEYYEASAQEKLHKLLIEDYHIVLDEDVYDDTVIMVTMDQTSYKVVLEVYNSTFSFLNKTLFKSQLGLNQFGNTIHINHCVMRCITHWNVFNLTSSSKSHCGQRHHLVQFANCKFYYSNMEDTLHILNKHTVLIDIASKIIDLEINNSVFNNGTFQVVHSRSTCFGSNFRKLLISNTTFSSIYCDTALIEVSDTVLLLEGPVIFTENSGYGVICVTGRNGYVALHSYIEISKSRFDFVFRPTTYNKKFIILHENTLVNISKNVIYDDTIDIYDDTNHIFYPPCYFQFTSERGNLDRDFANGKVLNYSIVFYHFRDYRFLLLAMIHCYWIPGSSFYATKPYDVYKKFIKPSFSLTQEKKHICYCVNDSYKDCTTHELGTVYPGQTMMSKLVLGDLFKCYANVLFTVTIDADKKFLPITACKLVKIDEVEQRLYHHCAPVQYQDTR